MDTQEYEGDLLIPQDVSLFEFLSQKSTLHFAWKKLNKSNPKSCGLSGKTISDFRTSLDSNLSSIANQLRKREFRFSKYRAVTLPKREKGKYRGLRVLEIKDRVVLKAIALILEEQLSKKFQLYNGASFAYLKGLGTETAIEQMFWYYARFPGAIILEADIEKFFDTIDRHHLLKNQIFPHLRDNTLESIIESGLNQKVGNLNDVASDQRYLFKALPNIGVPQGNSLSPLLSNVYLAPFDTRMQKEGYRLVRYADDFIVICSSHEEAKQALAIAKHELEVKLNLYVHDLESGNQKTRIVNPKRNHAKFLNLHFDGDKVFPTKDRYEKFAKDINEATSTIDKKTGKKRTILSILKSVRNILQGWVASYRFCYIDEERCLRIDDYINMKLYYTFKALSFNLENSEMTVFDYKRKGKKKLGKHPRLSHEQRKNSGIPTCGNLLEKARTGKNMPFMISNFIPRKNENHSFDDFPF